MDHIIKYRMLIDELNDSEKQLFLSKLMKSTDINFILEALFNHFSKSILALKPYNVTNVGNMIEIISKIIHARKDGEIAELNTEQNNEATDTPLSITKIDELPPPLLSQTASFLPSKTYIAFQNSNRKLYIGCNSPFSMKELTVSAKKYNHKINWQKFMHIDKLKVNTKYFIQSIKPFPGNIRFTNIRDLSLEETNDSQLKKLRKQNYINFANINRLHCGWFGIFDKYLNKIDDIDGPLFFKFLAGFINLEYLSLDHVYPEYYDDSQCPSLPKLKALKFGSDVPCHLVTTLLQVYGNQIRSLECKRDAGILGYYKLPKLQELCMVSTSDRNDKILCNILNNANALKIISICINMKKNSIESIDNMMGYLLTERRGLECIGIDVDYDDMDPLFDSVNKALIQNRNEEIQNLLKIRFGFDYTFIDIHNKDHIDFAKIILSARKIIDTLNGMNVNNFEFKCKIYSRYRLQKISSLLIPENDVIHQLDTIKKKYFVTYLVTKDMVQFVVSKK